MEGYFPIYKYCEITGCNKDTAYHRAERGTVESFKGKDGRWFLYFSDNRGIPEGFVSIEDYAKKIGVSHSQVAYKIREGYFKDGETITETIINDDGRPVFRRLIKENAEWVDYRVNLNKQRAEYIMNRLRPEGAYTVAEYAEHIGKSPAIIYGRIKWGKIKFVKVDGHYFIYPGEEEVS